jgi:hypothetical protein
VTPWPAALLIVAFGFSQATAAAQQQAQRLPLQITDYDTHSGITVTHFSFLQVRNSHRFTPQENGAAGAHMRVATNACVSFVNTLPRAVTQVDFHFVFYDSSRDHAGDAELVRSGSFAPNTQIDFDLANRTGQEDAKDCVLVPYHDPRVALAVVFVKSATFADGSHWFTSGPAVAEHLDPN